MVVISNCWQSDCDREIEIENIINDTDLQEVLASFHMTMEKANIWLQKTKVWTTYKLKLNNNQLVDPVDWSLQETQNGENSYIGEYDYIVGLPNLQEAIESKILQLDASGAF